MLTSVKVHEYKYIEFYIKALPTTAESHKLELSVKKVVYFLPLSLYFCVKNCESNEKCCNLNSPLST